MCFKQKGTISSLNGKLLKLEDQFTYLVSNISSTENDDNVHIKNIWTAIDRLFMTWKSDLSDKFLQVVAVSVLLFGYTDFDKTHT